MRSLTSPAFGWDETVTSALAECVNFTKIVDLKQEIRVFSYGTSSRDTIFYEENAK